MTSHPTAPRLRFREYRADDAAVLAPVFSDAYAKRFYPHHSDPGRLTSWIEWSRNSYREHGFGLWALELLPGATFAGDAGLTLQSVEGELLLEIGYHIHPDLRGQRVRPRDARNGATGAFRPPTAPGHSPVTKAFTRSPVTASNSVGSSRK